jgi:PAS domain S-box-containing protein
VPSSVTFEPDEIRSAEVGDPTRLSSWFTRVGLLEHTEDAVVVMDAGWCVLGWTKAAERMYGWPAAEALGRPATAVAQLDLTADQQAAIRRAALDTGRWRGEVTAAHRDGTAVEAELIVAALRETGGEFIGFLAIHRDLTERKRSETALRDAQRRTTSVLESITDGVFGLDREWRYTYINDPVLARLRRRVGEALTREEIVGKTIWQLLPDTVGTEFAHHLQDAMREQRVVECEFYFEPTHEFVETRIYPSEDGLAVCYRDVTERRRTERQLAYHAELLESMEDAVIAMDDQFVVTAWNRGAQSMLGWTADEAIGRSANELNSPSFSDEEHAQQLSALAENGRWRGEAIWLGKHGKSAVAEIVTVALRSAQGKVTGYLAILRDVADQRRVRIELLTRARQQTLVAELSRRARGSDDLQALLDDAVALLAGALEVGLAAVSESLPGGQALRWRARFGWNPAAAASVALSPATKGSLVAYTLAAGQPVISEAVAEDRRFEISPSFAEQGPVSAITVVIPGQPHPFGVLSAAARERRSFTWDDISLMQTVANVLGTAVERSHVEERLEEERENERRRIARELHDEALCGLTDALASATLARLSSAQASEREQWASQIKTLQGVAQQVRSSIYNLRLTANEARSFADLLTDLVAIQDDIAVDCQIGLYGREMLPAGSSGHRGIEVLRIVGEAITNARRHSDARIVRVDARRPSQNILRLEISDDGRRAGQDSGGRKQPGAGITGMLERADLLEADLQIESRAEGGTTVRLDLALDRVPASR